MRDYIPIDKEEIPQRFEIDFADESFGLEINYNEMDDFFTIDLYDAYGAPIVLGEKLMLGVPLWSDITNLNLPGPPLVPLDESAREDRITFENFGVSVFLYIDDVGEDEENGD